MNEKTNITLNSTILYVAAFLLTTIIHEFAHALIGLLNGSNPVLHHNYVEHLSTDLLTIPQLVSIALAGPIISLLQGILVGWVYLRSKNHGILQLFLLWFSVLGFTNFLGYLMTGPIFKAGDIGKAYLLLDWPISVQIIIALLGAAALLFIAYKMTEPFLKFSYKPDWVADGKSRKHFSFHILILPWIIGSAIITFLYLPIIAIVSIIYPVMSGFVFIYPWQNAQGVEDVELSKNDTNGKLSILAMCLLLILIFLFKWLLAPGIHF